MKALRHIPNLLTITNLVLGVLGVIAMANGLVLTAVGLLAGGLVADVLDGAVARLLKADSPLGVQLDSLADLVTFGVLPAAMVFFMGARFGQSAPSQPFIAFIAALLVASTALRLARFNIDDRPRAYFYGLATPAGGILVATWLWAQWDNRDFGWGVSDMPWLAVVIPLLLAVLYQVPLRLPGLKSPSSGRWWLLIPVVVAVAGFVLWGPIAVTLAIAVYVLLGLMNLIFRMY